MEVVMDDKNERTQVLESVLGYILFPWFDSGKQRILNEAEYSFYLAMLSLLSWAQKFNILSFYLRNQTDCLYIYFLFVGFSSLVVGLICFTFLVAAACKLELGLGF